MPIPFTCPHCGSSSTVGDEYAGQSGPCASCGMSITIPGAPMKPGLAAPPVKKKVSGLPTAVIVLIICGVLFVCCGGGGIALLLPAVQAAREAARRMECQNNLKRITIGLHNYHDSWRSFPPAYTVDANGKKLHSWRTLLLPYVGYEHVYEQIDLDKPWDDPANRAIANTVIPLYGCPSDVARGNSTTSVTSYMAIVGPKTAWPGERTIRIRDIADGTTNTLMVVEVKNQAVSWMEPVDLDASQMQMAINGGPSEICSNHLRGANCASADGMVRFFSEDMTPELLRAATTRAGGEAITLDN